MTWLRKPQKTGVLRPERCPVCKVAFGTRYFDMRKSWHCIECRATFTFHPYESKPTVITDRQKDKFCGCGQHPEENIDNLIF